MITIKDKYIIKIMEKGYKHKSESIFFKNFKKLQKKHIKESNEIFKISLMNSTSFFSIKKIKRKRKASIEFPVFLNEKTRIMYSLKHLTETMTMKNLYDEIISSATKKSKSSLNKEEIHKNSFLKKKAANFRWF